MVFNVGFIMYIHSVLKVWYGKKYCLYKILIKLRLGSTTKEREDSIGMLIRSRKSYNQKLAELENDLSNLAELTQRIGYFFILVKFLRIAWELL